MFYSKIQLLDQLNNSASGLYRALTEAYACPKVLANKIKALRQLLEHNSLANEAQTIITRCPGRISLSKHADYINNELLYTLGDRDIFLVCQLNPDSKLKLINLDEQFPSQEIALESLDKIDKQDWAFYPATLFKSLGLSQGLVLAYTSDLPAAGGLSSSHALMLSTLIAMVELCNIEKYKSAINTRDINDPRTFEIIELCQRVEHSRGFSSGLGDQSAQFLGRKNSFSFIRLYPKLQVEYKAVPSSLAIISAPSFIKADKSLPEFKAANENIKRYKEINQLAKQYNCGFLGDLLYEYSEEKIFTILESIDDPCLRGLALYGLAEGARVKEIYNNLSLDLIGKHLNLSHQAEKNFCLANDAWQALSETDKLNYKFDSKLKLAEHSGIYLASTLANDKLQYCANQIPGVCGSSISGAGLGGNNTIICDLSINDAETIKQTLIDTYYKQEGLAEQAQAKVHINTSSAAAGRLC